MKTLKFNSLKVILGLLLVAALFPACTKAQEKTVQSQQVEKPQLDIHTAVMTNNLEVVKQHIAAGSDINEKEPFSGSTPLVSAITFGKTEIAKSLIEAGADLSLVNNDGATPLHVAAFFGRVEIVQLLLDADADKTLKNNFGFTPRETVMGSFEEVKPIYEMMKQQLGPLGLELDMEQLEKTRPVIAMMLQ
ncbi:ankyrin repeat domain-containing protein [Algoriphagus kandeliae]|uniref:Ankyrin repeat domain-containing protein n=1 Tax=Algoriphagus kandeliae TaxID=2562278 RepID=A0A4Y9QTU9_9BACT|nr:ankyrin repeat domain-containing protein [Algoriphagus kandeliae]TFV96011.1 ankyrin repeat domain-containing protein [Algoriphagus kandeliae]